MSEIDLIKEVVSNEPMVSSAYLFGSRAVGKATVGSDFDIAVYLNNSLNKQQRFDLRLDLIGRISRVLKTDKVDLVVINDIGSVFFKFIIYKEGQLLYERNLLERCEMEGRIMSDYFDFEPFLDEYNKNYLNS